MYRKIMIGSGVTATAVTAGYIVAAVMAASGEVELSSRVGGVSLTLILGLTLMSGGAWMIQTANRESLTRDLPPILDRAIATNTNAIAVAIANQLAERLEGSMGDVAEKTHCRTVAAFREIITSELVSEQLDAAARRIHRYGMVTEATGRANVAALPRRN